MKANPKLKTTFQALDIKNLGDLFNSVTNLFFTNEEFIRIIKSAAPQLCAALNLPNLTSGKVRRTFTILSDLVGQIPPAIKTIMIQGDTEYIENEIVAFTETYLDGSSEVLYGKYSRTQNTLETLRIDSSGYYEPVGVPHDTSTWDDNFFKSRQRPIAEGLGECNHAWVRNVVVLEAEVLERPHRPIGDCMEKQYQHGIADGFT